MDEWREKGSLFVDKLDNTSSILFPGDNKANSSLNDVNLMRIFCEAECLRDTS